MTDPTPTELGQRHADERAAELIEGLAQNTRAGVILSRRFKIAPDHLEYLTAKAARLEKLARALRGEKQ